MRGACSEGVGGGACRLAAERHVKRELVAEGLLLATVGKPVINSHFRHEVRAQACELGRGHTTLQTLCPAGGIPTLRE